jgi:hypothetical protein
MIRGDGVGGVYGKTDHFRHTGAYHNIDYLATCRYMMGCHDIHALLHGFFIGLFFILTAKEVAPI